MSAVWYDVLDVEPTATSEEILRAWRDAVAELDPTDRRFRVYNQAAEVLLDPAKRAAYDAELAASVETTPVDAVEPVLTSETAESADVAETAEMAEPAETAEPGAGSAARRLPVVPGWALVAVAGLVAAALVVAGVLVSKPSDAAVESDTQAAQAAAERAIVPLLSYDAKNLDRSQAVAEPFMTAHEKAEYDKLFAVVKENAPRTGTVIHAKYLASGIVRSGTDEVDVLVFVDQATLNKEHPKVPVVYKNQVVVTMAKVGGQWLVDDLHTNPA